MKLAVLKETKPNENRVALTPEVVRDLTKKGFAVLVERGAGLSASLPDEAYAQAGAELLPSAAQLFPVADAVLKVNAPSAAEIATMKPGAVLLSFLWAASHPALVEACCRAGISAFALEAIPRISRAQRMDVLSSQANLGGYKAVLLAANTLGKLMPMMTTAAGTIRPAKVVVFGAGVAGLQAIATARRLGAVVEVSDIRPETKEQVESLGGKFIQVQGDDSIQVEGGYVKGVSGEFLKRQQELVASHVRDADIVITTALIPGRPAPRLVTEEMVRSMRLGSVIVDMAVEQGGNVAGSEPGRTVVRHGVTLIGEGNLPSHLPLNASELYAGNISAFLLHLAGPDGFKWEMDEEITKGSLIIHQGRPVHPSVAPAAKT
jgi:NAD(P) transhydrogenase subunit alpha